MRFELSCPKEIEYAKEHRWPLIMPLGVLEYHGPHDPYGVDGIVPEGVAHRLEKMHDGKCVIMPTFWYGAASFAVTTAEKGCSINVAYDALDHLFTGIFDSLLRHGWRNIYCIQFHQSEDLNPMQLSIMKAARSTVFNFLQNKDGEGWWGNNTNADFYASADSVDHPWNWIKVIRGTEGPLPGLDHAGKWETSATMALRPEAVHKERWNDTHEWFCETAKDASAEAGEEFLEAFTHNIDVQIKWQD